MSKGPLFIGSVKIPVTGAYSQTPGRGTMFMKEVRGGWRPDRQGEWPGKKIGALARALCEAMPPRTKVGIQLSAEGDSTVGLTINGARAALSFAEGWMTVTMPKTFGPDIVAGFSRFFGENPFARLTPPGGPGLFSYLWTRDKSAIGSTIDMYHQAGIGDLTRLDRTPVN